MRKQWQHHNTIGSKNCSNEIASGVKISGDNKSKYCIAFSNVSYLTKIECTGGDSKSSRLKVFWAW
jgi:hypothetical protein